jgi:hypothetical protein
MYTIEIVPHHASKKNPLQQQKFVTATRQRFSNMKYDWDIVLGRNQYI